MADTVEPFELLSLVLLNESGQAGAFYRFQRGGVVFSRIDEGLSDLHIIRLAWLEDNVFWEEGSQRFCGDRTHVPHYRRK